MADEKNSAIFREIDEELRQEQLTGLAKRYGKFAAGGILVIILAVGGYKFWQAQERDHRIALTSQLMTAIAHHAEERDELAIDALAAVSERRGSDGAAIASLRHASLLAEAGDIASALAIYAEITDDGGLADYVRDLATLYSASLMIDNGDPSAALSRLTTIDGPDGFWRYSARELTAIAHLEAGDTAAAEAALRPLANDAAVPQGIRSRAADLLDFLNSEQRG